ncbi:MAG: tetratricopeptide repeat protein [Candidatus Hodarchaeales archaeon]
MNTVIDNGSKFKNQLIVVDALLLKAKVYWTTGEGKKSSSCVSECREVIKTLKKGEEKSLREAHLHIRQGVNSWTNSDHDKALESYKLGYKIGMAIQDKECIAKSLSSIGAVHILKGNFSEALTATKEGLDLFKEIGDKVSFADTSTNLGYIYWRQGELNQALEHIEVGLEIFREIGEKIRIAASYGNIGKIYFSQDETEKALNNLMAAKEYYEQIGNDFYLSRIIFHMIRVAIGSNQLKKAEKYFEELQTIVKDESSKSMVHQLKMAKALILKNTKRITNLAKSESLLREIVNDSIVEHEITTMALEHLCEIRLVELRTTSGDPLILEEIQGFVNKLLEIANQQNISPLLVQTYVLQSKMALLQNNGKFAKKLIIQAQDLAEKKGLRKLAISVSNEYDSLLSKINKKNPIFSNNPTTVIERVESVKFEETLTQMMDQKEVKIPAKLEESPILLLIIHESGLGVYSKEFSMKSFKEQLISGIITAINALLQDVFEVGGTIERIRYKDFRLVIKGIAPLLFVYVFKGHSYLPIKKLEKFIEHLENTHIWKVFCNVSKKGTLLSDADNQVIDDFIRKYFLDGSN